MFIMDDVNGRIRQLMFIVDDVSELEGVYFGIYQSMTSQWNWRLCTYCTSFTALTTFCQRMSASLRIDKFRIRTSVLRLLRVMLEGLESLCLLWMMLAGLESLCLVWMMLASRLKNLCWLWIMLAGRLDAYDFVDDNSIVPYV